VKVFEIKANNHEEHEGHEEKFVKNFVFSAIAPASMQSSVFFVVNIAFGVV
jgi:hypothetical protein